MLQTTIRKQSILSVRENSAWRRTTKALVFAAVAVSLGLLIGSLKSGYAAAAACAPSGTTYGTDTLSITVPSDGSYYIWARMQAPAAADNGFMMQVDGSSCFNVGGNATMPLNSWTWVNYQGGSTSSVMQTSLTQGSHTITLIGTDPGVSVDRVELLADSTCTPSGTGDNCAPSSVAPPSVSLTAPASTATVSGSSVLISATASSAAGVSQVSLSQVVFKIDGTTIGTDTSSPYSLNWNSLSVANGTHTLTATATDSQGQPNTAIETFNVNNVVSCSSIPSAPSGVHGSSSNPTSLTLSWTAAVPGAGCAIASYSITEAGVVIGTTGSTSYTVTGLNPNTIYNYTVSATDNSGHTSATGSGSVTTAADTTPPTAPGAASAQAVASAEVQLSWSPSSDNVGVAYYRIYRNGSLLHSTTSNSTDYTDTSAVPATTYSYTISAVDSSGNESAQAATTPVSVTTPAAVDKTPPSQPTNLHSTLITSSTAVIAWNASTDNVGVAGYRIYRAGTLIGTVTSGTSYTDVDLSPSTNYSYDVVAFDSSGNVSAASGNLAITTLVGAVTACSPDYNHDGVVDFGDAIIIFSHWNMSGADCAQGDLNNDGVVNFFDAVQIFTQWGDKI